MLVDWFRIKGRSLHSLAFSFHRLTGIVLMIYLILHLTYLTSLRFGKESYEYLISLTVRPETLPFDLLLLLATVFHGVNGIRLVIHELGFVYEKRNLILYLTFGIVLIVWLYAGYLMFLLIMG